MAFDARGQLVTYFPILLIYGLLLLGILGSLVWWRLTYPRRLTGYGMRRCSPSSLPLGFLLFFAYSCLVFSQIVPFRHLWMERPLPPFLSTVVFLRVLFYLQLYSYFSLTIFSTALLTLFTLMLMTQLYILLLISNLLSFASRVASRLQLSDSILADLDGISLWGQSNLVKFNSLKTQLLHISLSKTPPNFPILFDGSPVSPVNYINILGLNINNKLSWKPQITMVAKAASKKLGILFRLREFFSSEQLLQIYKGLIRPCMGTVLTFGGAPAPPLFWIGLSQKLKD